MVCLHELICTMEPYDHFLDQSQGNPFFSLSGGWAILPSFRRIIWGLYPLHLWEFSFKLRQNVLLRHMRYCTLVFLFIGNFALSNEAL